MQSEAYLLTINKIDSHQVLDILGINDTDKQKIDTNDLINVEDAISPFVPPINHEQSEDNSIDLAKELLLNGLKVQGSRHNALFRICLLLKYSGYEPEDCRNEMYTWMEWQNTDLYTTKLDDCYKDIDRIVRDTWEKNYNFCAMQKDLSVSLNEMKWIIDNCPEKNQKLITFALLKHSKRHADMQGVFYMPFTMIAKSTGLVEKTARSQANKLINMGIIEAVERKIGFQKEVKDYNASYLIYIA